ncbi:MAG: DUF494 family protein [Candidatus Cloacimonetes bacterium]|nr:DUF494 family protein [Candidatus Cloacimonadota bacterium]
MKKDNGVNDLLDILFSEGLSKNRLLNLGFSEEDAENLLKMMHQDNNNYMRILNWEERESLTSDAIIYLLSMLQSGAIDRDVFEHVIAICMQIVYFTSRKMDKQSVDNILNFVIFNETKNVPIKEMIELFFMQDYEIEFDDEVN